MPSSQPNIRLFSALNFALALIPSLPFLMVKPMIVVPAPFANIVQPGGGLHDLSVRTGLFCQANCQPDYRFDMLPAVVKGHFFAPPANSRLVQRCLLGDLLDDFAPRWQVVMLFIRHYCN